MMRIETGGACEAWSGTLRFTSCTIRGNSVTPFWSAGGAVRNGNANITMVGCELTGNTAAVAGGAVSTFTGTTDLHGCTLAGNQAPTTGGHHHSGSANGTITNTILWGNTDDGANTETAQIDVGSGSVTDGHAIQFTP